MYQKRKTNKSKYVVASNKKNTSNLFLSLCVCIVCVYESPLISLKLTFQHKIITMLCVLCAYIHNKCAQCETNCETFSSYAFSCLRNVHDITSLKIDHVQPKATTKNGRISVRNVDTVQFEKEKKSSEN